MSGKPAEPAVRGCRIDASVAADAGRAVGKIAVGKTFLDRLLLATVVLDPPLTY